MGKFVKLEVGGCRPLYLLVCSKNAFFCHRMLDWILMGIQQTFASLSLAKGFSKADALIIELSVTDRMRFRLSVTDRKIEKAAALLTELSSSVGEVAIRQVAGLVGLLGSFYLAMGPRSRFHSRGPMTFVASQVQKSGWESQAVLDAQCQAELDFWIGNLRSINGAPMRVQGMVRDLSSRDLVSDAGSMLVGVTEFVGGVEEVSKRMQEPLSEDDLGESSTFHELQSSRDGLTCEGRVFERSVCVLDRGLTVSCHYSESGEYET